MYKAHTTTFYVLTYWIFLFGLLVSSTITAQSPQYKSYGVKDGLPSSEVYSAMQDSKGYMWFGTDHGACRFDGYTFKSFTPSDGLADPMVLECIEDYKGRIWFRSLSGRLSYYYNDSIFKLPVNDSLFSILHGALTTSISIDTTDCIYIATLSMQGIVKIDMRKKYSLSLLEIVKDGFYLGELDSGPYLFGSTFSKAYLTPSLGLYHINRANEGLDKLSLFTWEWDPSFHSLSRGQAIKLPGGKIAVAMGPRFIIINKDSISFSHYFNSDIIKLSIDRWGNTWIVCLNEAPVLYSNGDIVKQPNLNIFKNKSITSVCTDREGGIWLTSTDNGVLYLNSLQTAILSTENGLPWKKVNFVGITPDKSLFISSATSNVLSINIKDSISNHIVPGAVKASYITSMLYHPDKSIWIGSTSGVSVLKDIYSLKRISFSRALGMYHFVCNPDGTVWGNENLFIDLLKLTDSIHTLKRLRLPSKIFSIYRDHTGGLWIGTMNGLFKYENDSIINYGSKFPALKNAIECIKESSTGYLWMSTRDTGIIVMHNNTLLHLTASNGLLSNLCKCLALDYKGNIWVGSKEGLSHIVVHIDNAGLCHVDTIKNMNTDNLIEVNYITCDSNMVYVATNNGLTSFNMDKIETNKTPPPIYITSVKVNNKLFYSSVNSVKLHYDENYISINFLGIAYHNAGNVQYRYKMTGIDTGWVYTKYTSMQYPKLEPGNYTFSVSAMNNDGVWSISPATFTFIIAPPFWATWWARTAMGLIVIALIYWRIKVVEKREKNKTEVNKQLATFELKELKAQLDPHFLFNSLNTLTHLVEKVPAQAPEFVEELSTFYRYTLLHRNSEFTELKSEIEQAERYLKLLRIRFGDQLKVNWNIAEEYMDYLIPTNSLQLLFENITKHNVIMPDNPLWAEITTTPTNSLVIKNQLRLKPVPPLSNGIGLNSINERYRLMASKKINITQTTENFSVELPLISPQEYENINY